jgi:hypothetical protein
MQLKEAREVMGVSRDCSLRELNKRYRILALRLHPDKNGDTPEATLAFQELNTAYQLLLSSAPENDADANDASGQDAPNATYINLFMSFIKSLFRTTKKSDANNLDSDDHDNHAVLELLYRIIHDYASSSVTSALDALDPSVLFQLYETLEQYNACMGMDAHIFKEITNILREKMQKNNIIVLKPSLKDVIQNNISVLQHANQTFYVPLWHSELHYRVDLDKQLIVKCMPVLPDHMSIDVNNELHIDVRADIKELLGQSSGVLRIPLYDDACVEVKMADLRIMPRQTVVLQNNAHGISLICATDIYEVKNRAPICVHVTLI